jgi:PhnB protein
VTAPLPYLAFPGTAREALGFYRGVFGGDLALHTYEQFGRTDGPGTLIAHGVLTGPVSLAGSDAATGEESLHLEGVLLALLGTAPPDVLAGWFAGLAVDGVVLDPLEARPWGATDGRVRDRFGVSWLVGWEH